MSSYLLVHVLSWNGAQGLAWPIAEIYSYGLGGRVKGAQLIEVILQFLATLVDLCMENRQLGFEATGGRTLADVMRKSVQRINKGKQLRSR